MRSLVRRFNNCERGESGIGIIVGVLVIGSLIAALSYMQSCFYEGKEAKKHRRVISHNDQVRKQIKERWEDHRAPTGYQVKY